MPVDDIRVHSLASVSVVVVVVHLVDVVRVNAGQVLLFSNTSHVRITFFIQRWQLL